MPVFNNKKGSAIVETAMVFPLVIISVITLVLMMIYFYMQLDERVDMHIALRAESGKLCENMYYKHGICDRFSIYKKSQQIYSNSIISIDSNIILKKRKKEIVSRKYLIDECRFLRLTDALGEGTASNEE